MTNLQKIQDLFRQLRNVDAEDLPWSRKFTIANSNNGTYDVYKVTDDNIVVMSENLNAMKFPLTMFNEEFLGELYKEYVKTCVFRFNTTFVEQNLKFYV